MAYKEVGFPYLKRNYTIVRDLIAHYDKLIETMTKDGQKISDYKGTPIYHEYKSIQKILGPKKV